jgi:PAS domain S-box-containing protein
VAATGSRVAAFPAPPPPARLDVEVALDDVDTVALDALQDALDLGQQLATQGQLLVRPALDELVTLRDWACDQIKAQSGGGTAVSWDNALLAGRSIAEWPMADWDDTAVRTSPRPVVAGDDSNRLIAVSPAAAELLGGSPEDFVGLRITAIIPDRLREQHVAGFIRHLATGDGRVLGVRLNLPVLRLDGEEILRCLLIEQQMVPGGRSVYVAWLDPLPTD